MVSLIVSIVIALVAFNVLVAIVGAAASIGILVFGVISENKKRNKE